MWFHRRRHGWGPDHTHGRARISLADAPPGVEVTLLSFAHVDPAVAGSLRAYGLMPGRRVRVLSQQPETIIQVEQAELALEHQLSRAIFVRLCPREAGVGSNEDNQGEDCSASSRSLSRMGRRNL